APATPGTRACPSRSLLPLDTSSTAFGCAKLRAQTCSSRGDLASVLIFRSCVSPFSSSLQRGRQCIPNCSAGSPLLSCWPWLGQRGPIPEPRKPDNRPLQQPPPRPGRTAAPSPTIVA